MSVTFPEIRVGQPVRHEGLSVFPLFGPPVGEVEYILSDEAIQEGSVTVEEISESGSVPELSVENKGDVRVLFLEGEELIGAKQNRILNTSVLIAAHTKTKLPVSCVEAGRWGYKSRKFGSGGTCSPSKLRSALKGSVGQALKAKRGHRSDQGRVWEEVHRQQAALCCYSATSAMSDTCPISSVGCDTGSILLGPSRVGHETMAGRTNAGHQTGSGSAARRHHAVGALKQHTTLRQPVDIWRVDVASAVAGKFRSEIIDSDEQDIGTRRFSGGYPGRRQHNQDRE